MSLFSLAGLPSGSGRSGKTEAMGDSPLWENIFKNNSQKSKYIIWNNGYIFWKLYFQN